VFFSDKRLRPFVRLDVCLNSSMNVESCMTLQAVVALDIPGGLYAAPVADKPEDHLPSNQSEERQSRLQLHRHASISSGHYLQPKSLQVALLLSTDPGTAKGT